MPTRSKAITSDAVQGLPAQFWQAVKKGAYQAALDCGVGIDFEGPATESQVDVQIDMLTTILSKHPSAIAFAALDTKAALPLLNKLRLPRFHYCL